jgi:protein phosphatase
VTVYRGINQSIAGISLSHPYSRTGIMLDQVPTPYRSQVDNTISASSLTDANNTVTEIRNKVTACEQYYSNLASWNKAKAAHNAAVMETQKSHHPPIKIPPAPSGPQPTEPAGLSCAAASFYPASGSS